MELASIMFLALLFQNLVLAAFRGVYYGKPGLNTAYSVLALLSHGVAIVAWFVLSEVNISNSCT
jgi:hypothetical protein